MYQYDKTDSDFVHSRVAQFRDQVQRRLTGSLTEEEFKPLRLMHGVYLQLHAYMLRVAIPYGTLSARQLRALANIAEKYDRGYGHFTTRQNIQFNWLALVDIPDLLEELAEVDMHSIQTSGNCIRNITADPLAGVAADELADPRPSAELLRQWFNEHAEFSYLPRKFKIAVTGAALDRSALYFHDLGLRIVAYDNGAHGYEVIVGGGQGRTPMIGRVLNPFVAEHELLDYIEAILRVYNLYGRRDNKYKARIKILIHELGIENFAHSVVQELRRQPPRYEQYTRTELARISQDFSKHHYRAVAPRDDTARPIATSGEFEQWLKRNVEEHKVPGYAIAYVTLKNPETPPGDISAAQMRATADVAERYTGGELRITHTQNIVLPSVRKSDLFHLWSRLSLYNLASANHRLISDTIACPGLDYCSLANARSIPVAQAISARFQDLAQQREIGPLAVKISGCVNACGHHHVGDIGILGVEKSGKEFYQLTIGGRADERPAIGTRMGRALEANEIPAQIEKLTTYYLAHRTPQESFAATVQRLGSNRFKEALHATDR